MMIEQVFKLMDDFPAIPIGILAGIMLIAVMQLRGRKLAQEQPRRKTKLAAGVLGSVLFWWTPRDAFRVRDLLNGGVVIVGRAGSGKTSSSRAKLGRSIVRNRNSGGLIIAAKPEDVDM